MTPVQQSAVRSRQSVERLPQGVGVSISKNELAGMKICLYFCIRKSKNHQFNLKS